MSSGDMEVMADNIPSCVRVCAIYIIACMQWEDVCFQTKETHCMGTHTQGYVLCAYTQHMCTRMHTHYT